MTKERKLKLIWDFKGPTAFKVAEHHAIHLKEYALAENMAYLKIDTVALNEMHSIAYIAVMESVMKKIRDDLKPHRGQLFED